MWPELKIPSKTKAPVEYVDAVWGRIQEAGYSCEGVRRPVVDHVDAMLCAIVTEAIETVGEMPEGTVGRKPVVDLKERVLREGWIVGP